MKGKYIILAGLIALVVFLSACSSEKPLETQEVEQLREDVVTDDTGEEPNDVLDTPCTSSSECPEDYSCYAELPLGPSAGVKGSPENPGKCYSNEMIGQIY